jgi:probable F420-dependent oxidoreductase
MLSPLIERVGSYIAPGRQGRALGAVEHAKILESYEASSVWLSERWGTKDFSAIAGALAMVTDRCTIGIGVTHFQTRHPAVFASACMTLQELTNGRLVVGVGRSLAAMWARAGLAPPTDDTLVDYLAIVRQLCRGESVTYDGPAGTYANLQLGTLGTTPPPLFILAAVGPKTLRLAGSYFDGVLLHPFLSEEAMSRAARQVRDAAEAAGREPEHLSVHAALVAADDRAVETDQRPEVHARAGSYLRMPGVGEALCRANGWDIDWLQTWRNRGGDLPPEWIQATSLMGDVHLWPERIQGCLDSGVDQIVLHAPEPQSIIQLLKLLQS